MPSAENRVPGRISNLLIIAYELQSKAKPLSSELLLFHGYNVVAILIFRITVGGGHNVASPLSGTFRYSLARLVEAGI